MVNSGRFVDLLQSCRILLMIWGKRITTYVDTLGPSDPGDF